MDSFQQEAGQFVGFLTALGGVAVTALTLVLALDRERVNRRIFQLLPAALIAATIASFAAANLMLFTSGLPASPPAAAGGAGPPSVPPDLRFFLVSLTTVHTATALFLFTLMLLPAVYDAQGATAIAQRLGFWSFLVMECAAGVGVAQMVRGAHHPTKPAALAVSTGLAATLIVYFSLRPRWKAERASLIPFILSTAAVCAALVYYAVTFAQRGAPSGFDLWFFCLASSLPTASLIGLAIRIYREETRDWSEAPYEEAPTPTLR